MHLQRMVLINLYSICYSTRKITQIRIMTSFYIRVKGRRTTLNGRSGDEWQAPIGAWKFVQGWVPCYCCNYALRLRETPY